VTPTILLVFLFLAPLVGAAEFPRGLFVEDQSQDPPRPAFFNLQNHQLQAFAFRQKYSHFLDFAWDRERGRVFFSARESPREPFRIYLKNWPDGEEKVVYENRLGPFRFLLSPDGERFALQIMGRGTWPILAVHAWESQRTSFLGMGFSPDWSNDGRRLLFLRIPNSLPTYLAEYQVETDSATVLLPEPVTEAVYTEDSAQILLKTAQQAAVCDVFQVWNRGSGQRRFFGMDEREKPRKPCRCEREISAFPGHQFFYFKESENSADLSEQSLMVVDGWGSRLQVVPHEDWAPSANAVDASALVVGEDPLYLMNVDGTGGRLEIPDAGFIRYKK
jgi:hypothetical protein